MRGLIALSAPGLVQTKSPAVALLRHDESSDEKTSALN
jgi:hypothetical protein